MFIRKLYSTFICTTFVAGGQHRSALALLCAPLLRQTHSIWCPKWDKGALRYPQLLLPGMATSHWIPASTMSVFIFLYTWTSPLAKTFILHNWLGFFGDFFCSVLGFFCLFLFCCFVVIFFLEDRAGCFSAGCPSSRSFPPSFPHMSSYSTFRAFLESFNS